MVGRPSTAGSRVGRGTRSGALGRALRRAPVHIVAWSAAAVLVAPLAWMLSTSLKTKGDALAVPPQLLPDPVEWGNYAQVFAQEPFGRFMLNSLIVATSVTLVALLIHSMAAYALARLRFPARNLIFILILSTMMIPFTAIVIPEYILVQSLGWLDSYWALIVPNIPHAFGIFLLRQFYVSIPRDLEDAAIADGASLVQVYWHIVLPLSRPVLAALGLFFFLHNWNDFLWPVIVTQDPDLWVVQIGVQQFSGQHAASWNLVMAASTIALLPTLALFFVLQRRLIEGIKLSGLKG